MTMKLDDAWIEAMARAACRQHVFEQKCLSGEDVREEYLAERVESGWPKWTTRVTRAAETLVPLIAERCAGIAERMSQKEYEDCGRLGATDPETGLRECSVEVRGWGDCTCSAQEETSCEIARAIRREFGLEKRT